jgi:hypothetical protein
MSSLSTILVNRLVLNLRERAVKQLPTTIETAGKFQAALPLASLTTAASNDIRSNFLLCPTKHNCDSDTEAAASVPAGESPGQQLWSMDGIGYVAGGITGDEGRELINQMDVRQVL